MNFQQPNAAAIAVNRIFDTNGTQILGHLNANGQIYLINPNGILFGQGSQVNVGGLVASTLDINDASINGNTRTFNGPGTGSIVNKGQINGNYVALIGNTVSNQGTIVAQLGTVALGAGNAVTLTFAGNNLLHMKVDQSTLNNLAENGGLIRADGGYVIMTAGAKNELLASVVNNTGVIEARTVENHEGTITLLGGMKAGTVNVGGTLDASAFPLPPSPLPLPAANGGFIETSAAHVKVAPDAKVTTAASNGNSGIWLIDPVDFTIAASGGDMTGATLSTSLGSGNVTIQSGSGAVGTEGNVNVNDTVSWNANTLTLNAYNNINIKSAMNGSGSAKLALLYGQGAVAAGNTSTYSVNAPVSLAAGNNFSTKLGSDGAMVSYTVISSLGAVGSNTGTDLQGMQGNLSGNYALGSNIDATPTSTWNGGAGFTPIGNSTNTFTGTFDGLGHTISNLSINQPTTNYVGLFGYTFSTEINNVGLVGGSVNGSAFVGELVGYYSGIISNSYATGSVSGIGSVGGGYGGGMVGGLVGNNFGMISNSYATGSVSGVYNVGGILIYSVGGLVGSNDGFISNSYATATVKGSVSGNNTIGGLVGYNNKGIVSNSYATGSVSGKFLAGGLVGENDGVVSNSYSTGSVTGTTNVGGLVGFNNSGTISSSYWDITTSGQTTSAGGTGLTTAQALTQASYKGFDFASTWYMVDGSTRPFLRMEYSTTISNAHQLQLMGMNLTANYTLANNLDLAAELANPSGMWGTQSATVVTGITSGFAPIGNSTNTFTGTFDGLGHTISNLTINRPTTNFVGLFGYTGTGSLIQNVGLLGGSVVGQNHVGGLVGSISVWPTLGGTISDSYATGSVSGTTNVGGLVGSNIGTISNSYATGSVSGTSNYVGGLVGDNFGTISNSYSTGSVSGTGNVVGGLMGWSSDGTINNSYATGNVSGTSWVGGLVGWSYSTINNSYATGSVSGTSNYVGGLVGSNNGTISNSYATGSVSGTYYVGGLIGDNNGTTISNSYSTGNVSGTGYVGGLVGLYDPTVTISNSHYDIETVTINGSHTVTFGGLYDAQYQDWLSHGLSLNIANYLAYDSGSGYYRISNVQGLKDLLGFADNAAYKFRLTGNIDLSGTVGLWIPYFAGAEFDGAGHTISNLNVNLPYAQYVGMFGILSTASTVSNLGIVGGSVLGLDSVGGLVGYNTGTISDSYATGSVSGTNYVGGLVGYNTGTISDSYSAGNVTGVTGDYGSLDVGGLVGFNKGTVSNSYFTGSVTEVSPVPTPIPDINDWSVGGLVGDNFGTISNSYSTGNVSGKTDVGGLVGYNTGTISNTYSTGSVTGTTNVGGLVGLTDTGSTISNSFWDTQTSGQATSAGGKGMTTAQMQQQANFRSSTNANGNVNPGWDFAGIWVMYDGHTYPLLRSFMTPLTVTANDANKTYDGQAYSGGNGVHYSTTPKSNLLGTVSFTSNAQDAINVGSYTITPSGLYSNQQGYIISYASGALTVNQRPVNLTGTRVYDGTTAVSSGIFTLGNLVSGESLTLSGAGSVASKNVSAGAQGVTLKTLAFGNGTGGLASNYTFTGGTQTASFTPLALTGSISTGSSTYGASLAPGLATFVNPIAGDIVSGSGTVSVNTAGNISSSGNLKAGTYTGIESVSGSLTGADAGNYTFAGTTGDYTVGKLALSVAAMGTNKVYDGNVNDVATLSSSGVISGDVVNFADTSATFANKNVGNVKTVSVVGISASGADAANYSFNTTASTTANITPLAITVAATGVNKVYDTTVNDAAILSSAGVITGDTVNFADTSATFADKNVGNAKAVTVSGISASGTDAGNYTLSNNAASTTADITPASLIVTGVTANNKLYDATTAAMLGGAAMVTALGSDSVGVTGAGSGVFADKNVGTGKAVNISGFSLGGTDAGNYTVVQPVGVTADITPASLSVTGTTASDKVYDGTTTATLTGGALNGVILEDIVALAQTGNFGSKNVGANIPVTASDSLSGTDAGNYTIVQPLGLSANITPASLTYVATPASIIVGQTSSGLSGTVKGFVTGDTQANSTTGTLAWTTTIASTSQPGHYLIDGSGLLAANYVFTQDSGNATALTLIPGTGPDVLTSLLNNHPAPFNLSPTILVIPTSSTAAGGEVHAEEKTKRTITVEGFGPTLYIVDGGLRLPENDETNGQ